MSGPKVEFDADECQALLDLIDKIALNRFDVQPTKEEFEAMAKLREAAKFYVKKGG